MADGYEVVRDGNGGVLVILHPAVAISREKILELLTQAGIDAASVVFIEPAEAIDADADDRCVVVPIDQTACDNPELAEAARHCAQAGSGVVVLFGEGFEYSGLHPIAAGYGTQCGWSPEELRPRLVEGDAPSIAPTNTDGAAVNRPRSKQVNCK